MHLGLSTSRLFAFIVLDDPHNSTGAYTYRPVLYNLEHRLPSPYYTSYYPKVSLRHFSSLLSLSSLRRENTHFERIVSIDPETRKQRGVTIPLKCFVPLALLVAWLCVMQTKSFLRKHSLGGEGSVAVSSAGASSYSYQETKPILRNPNQHRDQCKLYLAESTVAKNAGLGIFTGIGLFQGEDVGFPDM